MTIPIIKTTIVSFMGVSSFDRFGHRLALFDNVNAEDFHGLLSGIRRVVNCAAQVLHDISGVEREGLLPFALDRDGSIEDIGHLDTGMAMAARGSARRN